MCFRVYALEDVPIRGKVRRDSINANSNINTNTNTIISNNNINTISSTYNNINNNSNTGTVTLDLSTNNSSKLSSGKIFSGTNSREGPSQKIDKSVLNKMATVQTTKTSTQKNDRGSKRDCVIF